MSKLLKYLIYTLFIPFWWIQLLIPRKKNVWVFGAWLGQKYADNAKVLFEYVSREKPEIKAIWLTENASALKQLREKGFVGYMKTSCKSVYYSLLAGKVIYSSGKVDVNMFFIHGAKVINLWHGAPMKKIGLDDKYAPIGNLRMNILKYAFPFAYDYNVDNVVSTAEVFNDKLSSAFGLMPDKIILSGYPRCDIFSIEKIHPLITKWNKDFKQPRKIFYLPTFRSVSEPFQPFKSFGFEENDWSDYLAASNSILISKGHFVDKVIGNSSSCNRIIHISDDELPELNEMLKDVDILITDFSGVYFDFLLLNKPIIMAPFDYDSYLSKSRELYFNYKDIVPEPICRSWNQILKYLVENNECTDNLKQQKEYKKMFNTHSISGNSKRLFESIHPL